MATKGGVGGRVRDITISFDKRESLGFVGFPPMRLESPEEITEMFDRILAAWRRECGGQRIYWLVDYKGYSFNVAHTDHYAECLRKLYDESAITILRYGGDNLQRAAARIVGIKMHKPSLLYATKEEALAVVKALKAGTIKSEPPSRLTR